MVKKKQAVAVYCCVTTTSPISLKRYVENAKAYIKKHADWTLVKVYSDRCPCMNDTNRPGLAELLNDAKIRAFDMLVILSPAKVARDTKKCFDILEQVDSYGIKIYSVDGTVIKDFLAINRALWASLLLGATCELCGQHMSKSSGCTCKTVYSGKDTYPRIPFGDVYTTKTERCPDCNAAPGKYHHLNCDMEICPVCGGQLLGCECDIAFEIESTR